MGMQDRPQSIDNDKSCIDKCCCVVVSRCLAKRWSVDRDGGLGHTQHEHEEKTQSMKCFVIVNVGRCGSCVGVGCVIVIALLLLLELCVCGSYEAKRWCWWWTPF